MTKSPFALILLNWLAHVSVIFKYRTFIQPESQGTKERQVGTATDHHNNYKNISIILQSPIWGLFILIFIKSR